MFSSLENRPVFHPPRDVLRLGTVDEVKDYRDDLMLRGKAECQAERQPQYLPYAFTEIITIQLPPGKIDIASVTTDEGKAFAEYVRTILETGQGLSLLRWGRRIEAPEMVVALLDWPDFSSWENMQHNAEYHAAKIGLEAHLAKPISSRAFDIQNTLSRSKCLGRNFNHNVGASLHTAIYIWDFPTPSRDVHFTLPVYDSDPEVPLNGTDARYYELIESSADDEGTPIAVSRQVDTVQDQTQHTRTIDLHWEHFAVQYYRDSANPTVPPGTTGCYFVLGHRPEWGGGWEVLLGADGAEKGNRSYCGVIGTLHDISAPYLKNVLGKSYEAGGLEPLKSIATAGLDIFHVELHNLTSWHGSVIPTPPATNLTSMTLGNPSFGGARGGQQIEGEKKTPTPIFGKW